jgi:rhodanese-related sulfurtransferase
LIESLTATALHDWLTDKDRAPPYLLDVREPWEFERCHIASAQLLPLQQIPQRWHELPSDRDIVVICHHGMRSLQAATFLEAAGLSKLYNLDGGVAAWATQVDPTMPRY